MHIDIIIIKVLRLFKTQMTQMTAFNDVALNFSNVISGFQMFDREPTGRP